MVKASLRLTLRLPLAALLVLLGVSQVQGQSLDQVRQDVDEIRYPAAARRLSRTIEAGELQGQALAEAHRMGGEIHAALGDMPQARDYFVRWLVLEPGAQLPAGTSPKIAAVFAEARAQARRLGALQLTQHAERTGGAIKVELKVVSDPLDMVVGARVMYALGPGAPLDASVDAPTGLQVFVEVPEEQAVRLRVVALDAQGNELSVQPSEPPLELAGRPQQVAAPRRIVATTPPKIGWYGRWYTYAALAVVTGGTGVFFGVRSKADESELAALKRNSSNARFADAQAIEQSGRRNALLANISFGATGLAAAASIVCAFRARRQESDTLLAPIVSRNGVFGLSLRRGF